MTFRTGSFFVKSHQGEQMKYTTSFFDIEVPDEELKQMDEFNCRTRVIEIATRELANVPDLDIQKVREFLDLISRYVVKEIFTPARIGTHTTYRTVRDYVKNKDIEKEILAKAEELQMNNRNFKSDVLENANVKPSEFLSTLKDMAPFVAKDSIDSFVKWMADVVNDIQNTLKEGRTDPLKVNGLHGQFNSTVQGCGKTTFCNRLVSALNSIGVPAEEEVAFPTGGFENGDAVNKNLFVTFQERGVQTKYNIDYLKKFCRREKYDFSRKYLPTVNLKANAITLGSTNGIPYMENDRTMKIFRCLPFMYDDFPQEVKDRCSQGHSDNSLYYLQLSHFYAFYAFYLKNFLSLKEEKQNVSSEHSIKIIKVLRGFDISHLLLGLFQEEDDKSIFSSITVTRLSKIYKSHNGTEMTYAQKAAISRLLNNLYSHRLIKQTNRTPDDFYKSYDLFEVSILTEDDLNEAIEVTADDELQEAQDYWDKMIEVAKEWEKGNLDPTDPTKIDKEKELNDTTTEPSEPSGTTSKSNELASNRGGDGRAEATDTANDTTFEPGISTATEPSITDRRPFSLTAWEENMKKEIAEELEKQLPDTPPVFYTPLEEPVKEEPTEPSEPTPMLEMINDNYELQDIYSAICADVDGKITEEQKDILSLKPKNVAEKKHLLTQQEMDEVKSYFDQFCGISKPKSEEPVETPNLQKPVTEAPITKTEYEYPEGFDLTQKKLTKEDVEKFDIQVVSEATNKTGHLEPLATDQFIVAARLKDKSQGLIRRTDLMEPVFFVYESDDLPLPEQQRILGPMRSIPSIFSMTYSGSKSIHTLVYIDPKDRDVVSQDYKFFWQAIGEELFGENAKHLDPACASIVRLTRLPGGFRYDTGKDQKCLYINRKCCGVNIVKANAKYQQKLLDVKRRQEETARKLEAFRLSGRESSNPDSIEHLENLFNKTNDPRADIALTLLNGGDPGSGANYIGAIGYVKTAIGPETAEQVRQAAHQLHPSNITKIV
jgi:hypothetical protein